MFSPKQLDIWHSLLVGMRADTKFTQERQQWNNQRNQLIPELQEFFKEFIVGNTSIVLFREIFDRKMRTEWDFFGLKGPSGGMFLNKLMLYISDYDKLSENLQEVLNPPQNTEDGREKLLNFHGYIQKLIAENPLLRTQLQPARLPFLISTTWHIFNINQWMPSYPSTRNALQENTVYDDKGYRSGVIQGYLDYNRIFFALAHELQLSSWELEALCLWQQREAEANHISESPQVSITKTSTSEQIPPEEKQEEDIAHAHVQWLLAKLGKHFKCDVWIARNDHSRIINNERLGDYSLASLPMLNGVSPKTQRMIELIDVVFFRRHQVVAAFEVEKTTSIYSGLLRLSDLSIAFGTFNFPVYITVPQSKLRKVEEELSRLTFQELGLHRLCKFFSYEELIENFDQMLKWAKSVDSFSQLAQQVEDMNEE